MLISFEMTMGKISPLKFNIKERPKIQHHFRMRKMLFWNLQKRKEGELPFNETFATNLPLTFLKKRSYETFWIRMLTHFPNMESLTILFNEFIKLVEVYSSCYVCSFLSLKVHSLCVFLNIPCVNVWTEILNHCNGLRIRELEVTYNQGYGSLLIKRTTKKSWGRFLASVFLMERIQNYTCNFKQQHGGWTWRLWVAKEKHWMTWIDMGPILHENFPHS
jgi:hypothetical protein